MTKSLNAPGQWPNTGILTDKQFVECICLVIELVVSQLACCTMSSKWEECVDTSSDSEAEATTAPTPVTQESREPRFPLPKGAAVITLESRRMTRDIQARIHFLEKEDQWEGYGEFTFAAQYSFNCCAPIHPLSLPIHIVKRDTLPCVRARNAQILLAVVIRSTQDFFQPTGVEIKTEGAKRVWSVRAVQLTDPHCLYKAVFKAATRRQLEVQLKQRFAGRAYGLQLEVVLKFAVSGRTIEWEFTFQPKCCATAPGIMALCERENPPQRICHHFCQKVEALRGLHPPNQPNEAIQGTSGISASMKRTHATIHNVSDDSDEEADPLLGPSQTKALLLQTGLLPKE